MFYRLAGIFLFAALVLINSCSVDDPVSETGDPKIIDAVPLNLNVSDTIKIYGKLFGNISELNYIYFNENRFFSKDCIKWQSNEIWFRIPDTSKTDGLKIVVDGKQSNIINLIINPVPSFKTVELSNGKFMMGSQTGSVNELPVHEVTLTKSFIISATEINQLLYRVVMNENPSEKIAEELPVTNIEWIDAVRFCNNLSKLQDLDTVYRISGTNVQWNKTANGWRLPTEAEWEYACRAGTTTDYAALTLEEIGWYSENSGYKSHRGSRKSPNSFGLYDMHGNVWEWCYDFYGENYYQTSPANDPDGPSAGLRRVLRGGSYSDGPNYARSSNRNIPELFKDNIGFRIVRNKF